MIYVFAAMRTAAILIGLCAALFVLLLLAGAVVGAFSHSWLAGSLVLAFVCGVGALFGHQLRRVAKNDRSRLVGFVAYFGFGTIAVGGLLAAVLVPLETYLWSSVYLPTVRHALGAELPSSGLSYWLAVIVFLDVSLAFILVAPIRFGWWFFTGR